MPAVFIHAKCRATVLALYAEYRLAVAPSPYLSCVAKSSSAPSSLVSGHRSNVRFAALAALLRNQCVHALTGEPSPGARNQPW